MKKWIILVAAVILAVALLAAGSSIFRRDGSESADFRTAVAARRDIGSSVLATGIIKPMVGAEVRVGSRVSGLVENLYANVGDHVEKGQIIAELEPSELQAKYNQAKAALENARADYEYARLDLKRQESMLGQNFISQSQYDLAEKSFEISRAKLEQAEANLAHAAVQLDYTKITAPIDGVIASVSTQEGETVAASFSAPTFVNIIDLNRLEVRAFVDETDIGRIRVGQKATFTVDTYMHTDFEGTVTAIYPKAEIQDNVVNYIATIAIGDFMGRQLRPEMTTTVTIYLDRHEDVLAVPTGALRREPDGMAVTLVEDGRTSTQRVETGLSGGGHTEILEGLREGDRIVIR